jgi:hypothetical protein
VSEMPRAVDASQIGFGGGALARNTRSGVHARGDSAVASLT